MECVDQLCGLGHCTECGEHDCACGAPLYQHPILLEPVHDERGRRVGYKVPAKDEARWSAPPVTYVSRRAPAPVRTIADLTERLDEAGVYLDAVVQGELHAAFISDPHRTARSVDRVTQQTGSLRNPAGLLRSLLRAP